MTEAPFRLVPGSTPSDWHQHVNGRGWVYKTATVEDTAYVGPEALVYGESRVSGNASVSGEARVYGGTQVFGETQVFGKARVSGEARVYGESWVYGESRVFGKASVFGDASVSGNALVYGEASVSGNALVYGEASVSGGNWEVSPPYIQGSRHAITLASPTEIAIGCHIHPINFWLENYREIGGKERYTEQEVEEYGRHLRYLAEWAKHSFPDSPSPL